MTWAQSYPSRPITIVVPVSPGGSIDVIARNLAERMRVILGQPVIIENVTGAGGTIGAGRVVRARPDGYTILVGNTGTVLNDALYSLPYYVLNDFEPVALLSTYPLVLVARKSMPANDLKGLIAWLKANPDKDNAGGGVRGGIGHIASLFFQKETGTRFQYVPYRGGALAIQDLMAGQIDLGFSDPTAALPLVRAGTIKAYGITAKVRLASAPDIPTLHESGLPGFDVSVWHGLWAPKATPKNIIAKLNAAAIDALAGPTVRARLADLGQEIFPPDQQTPEAFGAFQKAEMEKWSPMIKEFGIRGE
jgi:tripartite-type tricarboxylate transporter receptor subunit TctC